MIGQASESDRTHFAQTQTRSSCTAWVRWIARCADARRTRRTGWSSCSCPQKIGRDIGDVACLGKQLGVTVAKDIELVLADTRPDLVVMTIASYMEDMFEPAMACLCC